MIPFDKREGKIWYNNELIEWQNVKLHVLSHGLHYASCIFEGLRVYDGEIFKLEEHTERFFYSAKRMGMELPFTQDEINKARSVSLDELKHPEKDEDRVKNPEWLVMLGICTHLGCVPLSDKGEYDGWFCPCHGSHYDTSGRIRKGPAPVNMEIPEYVFLDENTIKIG